MITFYPKILTPYFTSYLQERGGCIIVAPHLDSQRRCTPVNVARRFFLSGGVKIQIVLVEYNDESLCYVDGMSYNEFCEKNPHLETRVEWDETTSDAIDAYYFCKERRKEQ